MSTNTPRRGTPRKVKSTKLPAAKVKPSVSRKTAAPKLQLKTGPKKETAPRESKIKLPHINLADKLPKKQAATMRDEQLKADQRASRVRKAIIAIISLVVLAILGMLVFLILSYTPIFTIEKLNAQASDHISAENIAKLAKINEGTTLLNLDEEQITANLRKNPWVGEVVLKKDFPSTLTISIKERRVKYLALMGGSSVAWYLGDDYAWIEPTNIQVGEDQTFQVAALAKAQSEKLILITDLPTSVSPVAGSYASDQVISAIKSYQDQFSNDFASQIVSYNAQSVDSISCVLSSGVEISLGSATNISNKESIIKQILAENPNQVTYINVRVPNKPSFRKVNSTDVSQGTGAKVEESKVSSDTQAQDQSNEQNSEQSDKSQTTN